MKYDIAINAVDFLDYKTILRYLLIFTIVLLGGAVSGAMVAILVTATILFYIVSKRLFKAFEWWLIWLFCFGFFQGQGFITLPFISKFIAKPSFLLFIIFLSFISQTPLRYGLPRFILAWILFLSLAFLSLIYHKQSPFVLITISSFFLTYYVSRTKKLSEKHCRQLLNFFLAAAVLQTIVCILQVAQIIPPSSRMMDDGTGQQFEWIAGLDDVACGTFGPVSGHIVSWYVSMIALFCIVLWSITRNIKYIYIAVISLMQFATIDSKTIMGVMVIMMLFLFHYITRNRIKFRLSSQKLISLGTGACVIGLCLFLGWDYYYQYQNKAGGTISRGNLNDVYKTEIKKSQELILENIGDWGKIKGFSYVFNDLKVSSPFDVLWGYGLLGYNYNGKMSYIESKDTPLMRLNNFTRSRSTLIIQFAQSGLAGFLLFFLSLRLWYKYNIKTKNFNAIDQARTTLLHIFLPFTLLAAFIYDMSITTITVISFSAMIGLLKRYSEIIEQKRYSLINNNIL